MPLYLWIYFCVYKVQIITRYLGLKFFELYISWVVMTSRLLHLTQNHSFCFQTPNCKDNKEISFKEVMNQNTVTIISIIKNTIKRAVFWLILLLLGDVDKKHYRRKKIPWAWKPLHIESWLVSMWLPHTRPQFLFCAPKLQDICKQQGLQPHTCKPKARKNWSPIKSNNVH